MVVDWVGASLGRYRIEGVIGQGAMGVVLRAHDPDLQRTVAIKVLYPHLAADQELVARFRRESRIGANLRHRNIVAIHDVGQEQGRYYLVMEYLEGRPLSELVDEQGALPPRQVIDIAGQIASALDYIHKQKLVHRDVKSSNIIVDQDGRAVLTDFGLVRALAGSTLTASGTILGTPQYIAPEQVSGGELGPWTDLYALGVVTYEMLAGRFPFDADPPSAMLFQILWQPPPSLQLSEGSLPEELDVVIARALAKETQERHGSGAEFIADLARALDGETETMAPAVPAARERKRALPVWLWVLLGGVVVLLALGSTMALVGIGPFSSSPTPTMAVPTAGRTTTAPVVPTTLPPASPVQVVSTTTHPSTARPTASPEPSAQPTAGITVQPTPSPSSTATETPGPTNTAQATVTPEPPTETPVPTVAPPSPTDTPIPTVPTTRPTDTPRPPTDTPKPPTETPKPPTETPKPPTETPPPPPTRTLPPQPTATRTVAPSGDLLSVRTCIVLNPAWMEPIERNHKDRASPCSR